LEGFEVVFSMLRPSMYIMPWLDLLTMKGAHAHTLTCFIWGKGGNLAKYMMMMMCYDDDEGPHALMLLDASGVWRWCHSHILFGLVDGVGEGLPPHISRRGAGAHHDEADGPCPVGATFYNTVRRVSHTHRQ